MAISAENRSHKLPQLSGPPQPRAHHQQPPRQLLVFCIAEKQKRPPRRHMPPPQLVCLCQQQLVDPPRFQGRLGGGEQLVGHLVWKLSRSTVGERWDRLRTVSLSLELQLCIVRCKQPTSFLYTQTDLCFLCITEQLPVSCSPVSRRPLRLRLAQPATTAAAAAVGVVSSCKPNHTAAKVVPQGGSSCGLSRCKRQGMI
jgi:hypothetical protein